MKSEEDKKDNVVELPLEETIAIPEIASHEIKEVLDDAFQELEKARQSYKDVMVDIETFGNGRRALMVQFGACFFNRETGDIGATIKINFDAVEMQKCGGEFDADTIYWWLSQSRQAQESIMIDLRSDLRAAFLEIDKFLKPSKQIWSHATFDFPIVMEAFKYVGVKQSFHFRNARDIRTLLDLANFNHRDVKRDGTHHDALDDCLHQVKYCVEAFKRLKVRNEKDDTL
jgi:hypothetical protein